MCINNGVVVMLEFDIGILCKKCGNKLFKIPFNPSPEDEIVCVQCGNRIKYGDLKDAGIRKRIDDALIQALRNASKRIK